MGYISITGSDVANFDKAVISLWFRIPQATIDALRAVVDPLYPHLDEAFNDGFCGVRFADPPLFGVIPLVTFGSVEQTLPDAEPGSGETVSPSFIGIDFSHEDTAHLAVNLQTATIASYNKAPTHPEDEYRPAVFYMQGWNETDSQALPVTGDEWHHILISFDISPSCDMTHLNDWPGGIHDPPEQTEVLTFGPTFSWAFDDESKVGNSMRPSGGFENLGADTNHIIPQLQTLGRSDDYLGEGNSDFVTTYSGMEIAQSGNPMGVPASSAFVSSVYNVIMAELQIFTGVTIDCGSEENRRAFITSSGRAASPSLAVSLLGKSPEVYFRTHANWSSGDNQGTEGDLDPTGTIAAYSPGP